MTNILCGPKKTVLIPYDSLGQWVYKALLESPPDFPIMTEGDTDSSITSRECLRKSCGLANGLKNHGVKKGDIVVLIGETSIKLNIAAMATVLIGAVMCPLDPLMKSFEFQHLLNIIKPKIVICDDKLLTEVRDAVQKTIPQAPIVVVDANQTSADNTIPFESLLQDVSVETFEPAGCEDAKKELVVVVCSSGSTGLPKGVAISQWSILYQIKLIDEIWPKGVCLLHTSYFYWISGVLMMYTATCMLTKRILVRTSEPCESFKAIHKHKPNVAMLSPSLLSAMVFDPQLSNYDISSMTLVFSGGSPVQQVSVNKLKEIIPNCTVAQGYGCTELGGIISKTEDTMDIMSIGILSENMKLKVVDRSTGKVLGPNQDGEFVIWSPTAMIGYYGNEEATKECMDEEGWYYTGDIGNYTEEGVLYITGRAKELMKVDNHQISPAEIEAVISQVEGVADVAVAGIDVQENTFPMALVVKRHGAQVSKQKIIQIVADKLSNFKQLRGGVHFVDHIPRTSTGKLKRRLVQPIADALYADSIKNT